VTLHDRIRIEFQRARQTKLTIDSSLDIADNIIIKAAGLALEALRVNARVHFSLEKRIPMGGGMGGGSSNAAAVLLALPAVAGKRLSLSRLHAIGSYLGSDVPFFLYGGTALGLGRGTELYPLPELPSHPVVVLASGIHVSTAEAYRALARTGTYLTQSTEVTNPLTSPDASPILREFQAIAWNLEHHGLAGVSLQNDFEEAVFATHPELPALVRRLKRLGAKPVRMTGSGSALFGIFSSASAAKVAARSFPEGRAHPVRFLPRKNYRALWARALNLATFSDLFGPEA
jgi:4-diphosphocytidyl-2-C-methyl-D-erythritol kinase